jgi:hypothetical protein
MITSKFNYRSLQIALFAVVSIYSIANASAESLDNVSYCFNSCKSPHCDSSSVQAECQKKCSDESIWKQIAAVQLSNDENKVDTSLEAKTISQTFQSATGQAKTDMLHSSPIAKCLNIVSEKVKQEPTPLLPLDKSAKLEDDLCAAAMAAVKEEITLNTDHSALKVNDHIFNNLINEHKAHS